MEGSLTHERNRKCLTMTDFEMIISVNLIYSNQLFLIVRSLWRLLVRSAWTRNARGFEYFARVATTASNRYITYQTLFRWLIHFNYLLLFFTFLVFLFVKKCCVNSRDRKKRQSREKAVKRTRVKRLSNGLALNEPQEFRGPVVITNQSLINN